MQRWNYSHTYFIDTGIAAHIIMTYSMLLKTIFQHMSTKMNFYMQLSKCKKARENSLAELLTTHRHIREKGSYGEVDSFEGK